MATAREMYEVVRSMRWAAAVKLPVSATQTKARMLKRMSIGLQWAGSGLGSR
ncbi:hypothetical protein D3C77_736770 [compost metagenome]